MSFESTTTASSTRQERTPLPIFNLLPVDNETLDAIDRIAEEKIKMGASTVSSLEGRVSPRLGNNTLSNDENDEDFDWDDDTDCNFPILTDNLNGSGYHSDDSLNSSEYLFSTNSPNSNEFYTPTNSPSKIASKKAPDSPEALKTLKAVMDNHHPSYDISPDFRDDFNDAIEKVSTWKTSPYKAKDCARQLFKEALERTGSVTEVPSPNVTGRRLIFSTQDYEEDVMGNWTKSLSKDLRFSFIDVKHLIDLERNGGFHICGPDHPRNRSVIKRRTNIWTDVWCGQICNKKDPLKILKEFSSFIPRHMSLEQYQSLLSHAINTPSCKIAEQGNRCLYKLIDENNISFTVECYLQEEGTRIKSAIPVFHYEVYNGIDTTFRVVYLCQESLDDPECIATYDVSYEKLFELMKGCSEEAILYNTKDKLIVDVGVLFSTPNKGYDICPIEKGVLVEIPKIYSNFML